MMSAVEKRLMQEQARYVEQQKQKKAQSPRAPKSPSSPKKKERLTISQMEQYQRSPKVGNVMGPADGKF